MTKPTSNFNGEKKDFLISDVETTGYPYKMYDLCFTPETNINFKYVIDFNVKGKTIKLLEDNIEKYLYDHGKEKIKIS